MLLNTGVMISEKVFCFSLFWKQKILIKKNKICVIALDWFLCMRNVYFVLWWVEPSI